MNLTEIRALVARTEQAEERLELPKDYLKATIESGCDALGLRKDAFKAARRLKKLKPGDLRAWLQSFEATCDALGFDDQLDIEDAIADVEIRDDGTTVTIDAESARRARDNIATIKDRRSSSAA